LTVLTHGPASRQREPQDVAVPLHGPADVGDLNADVPHTADRKSLGHCASLLAAGEALVRSVQGARTHMTLTQAKGDHRLRAGMLPMGSIIPQISTGE